MSTNEVAPRSLGRLLNRNTSQINAIANKSLEPYGFGLAQWVILLVLWHKGKMGIKALAAHTGNAAPATSRIVDRMIEADLLVRQTDPSDRRAVVVALTEKGESLRDLSTFFEEMNSILLKGFSEDEANLLFELLERTEQNGRLWLEEKK